MSRSPGFHASEFFDDDLRPRDSSLTAAIGGDHVRFRDNQDIEPDVHPLALPTGKWTLLPAIDRCDNATLPRGPFNAISFQRRALRRQPSRASRSTPSDSVQDAEVFIPFFVEATDCVPIGFLRANVVDALQNDNEHAQSTLKMQPCWNILRTRGADNAPEAEDAHDRGGQESSPQNNIWGVAFADWLNEEGRDARSEHMDRVCRNWQARGLFNEELKGWRNELYPIYGPKLSQNDPRYTPLPGANIAFDVERSACSIFGFATYGAHLTAYWLTDKDEYYIWVPRRARTKQTWPGCLDNSVAGGITTGDSPLETIIRECAEEASLPPDFVRRKIRAGGVVSYIYRSNSGWLQPEVQYVYDLPMLAPPAHLDPRSSGQISQGDSGACINRSSADAEGVSQVPANEHGEPNVLSPNDGEAEQFTLMGTDEIVKRILDDEFKPNCALVLIDFFIRHGLLTAESDTNFLELCTRIHRSISPLPGPA